MSTGGFFLPNDGIAGGASGGIDLATGFEETCGAGIAFGVRDGPGSETMGSGS